MYNMTIGGKIKMIKLWKSNERNKQFREIIAKARIDKRPFQWKYCNNKEKAIDIARRYDCSFTMAVKVVWVICGDCARQIEICNTLGKEYAMYVPTSLQIKIE